MFEKCWPAFKLIFKFSFSFIIIFYLIRAGHLDLSIVKKGITNIPVMASCLVLIIVGMAAAFLRWHLLLQGQGIVLSLPAILRYSMIGNFFNTALPGAVSGDVFKAMYVVSDYKNIKKTPVLTAILLDRIMGVFGLILVSASPVILNSGHIWNVEALHVLARITVLLFVGVIAFFAFIFLSGSGPIARARSKFAFLEKHKLFKLLLGAYDAWTGYRNKPSLVLSALALAVCTHLCVVGVVILSAHALGEDRLALFQYFLLAPIGLLSTAIPIAPAGLGVGHMAFAGLFRLAGSDKGTEVFTMLVTIQVLMNLTGVVFFLKSPKPITAQ